MIEKLQNGTYGTDDEKPPVILDNNDPDELRNLYRYIIRHSRNGHLEAAESERKRLAPYFGALSRRLLSVVKDNDPEQIEDFLKSESLSAIFLEVAKNFKNTIISEVMIVPSNTMQSHVFNKIGLKDIISHEYIEFKSGYNSSSYKFGFLQIFEKENGNRGELFSTIGIPVLALDEDYLRLIKPHGGENILKHLQQVMTWANHDMLHHYTSRIINSNIAKKFSGINESNIRQWSERYFRNLNKSHSPLDYEAWAVQSHVRTWNELACDKTGEGVSSSINDFLDELENLAAALSEQDDIPLIKKHAAIDYFGMAMAVAMTRIIPLKDKAFESYFDRLKQVDLDPDAIYLDLLKGREATRSICLDIAKRNNEDVNTSVYSGQLEFVRLILDYENDRGKHFDRILYPLSHSTLMARDELLKLNSDEFYNLLQTELEGKPDGVLLSCLDDDIRDFMLDACDNNFFGDRPRFEKLAKDNLMVLLNERKLRAIHNINKAENAEKETDDLEVLLFDYGFDEKLKDDYAYIKKLQLAVMVPSITYIHAKAEVGTRLFRAQKQLDEADIEMIRAVAKDIGIKPKPRI